MTFDDLHDARLLALIDNGDRQFILRFRTDTEKNCDVILDRVERLRCEDFREGNIVFSVSLSSKVAVSSAALRWVLGEGATDEIAFVQKLREQIMSGQLALFEIVPSYGAEMKAIVGSAMRRP